jgi:hypothetical protein
MKTTNINLRVSPLLKMQIMERGAKMGANLSDYIGFVLTKEMVGQNDPKESEEYKELAQRHKRLQTEFAKYQAVAEPYKYLVGKDVPINGKTHRFEHVTEVIANILSNFKVKN